MKVLMVVRTNFYDSPGGDTTQVLMTAQYLRKLSINVDIAFSNEPVKKEYDLFHFFNIIRPDDILPFIRKYKIPFVVSTIFVDYYEFEKKNRAGIIGIFFKYLSSGQIEYLKAIGRWLRNGDKIKSTYYLLHGHKASIKYILRKSSMILPNSNSEYNRLVNYIGFKPSYEKVVNAIDEEVFCEEKVENLLYKNHILCVGRIEGRKNQLNLIKALLGSNIDLTIIGKPSINHLNYYMECKRLAATTNNIHFIDQVSPMELARIYKAAKVHILPSWFETTGLSSLEAGVMGCNVVVTKNGDTEEYFKDMAYYCDPNDINSIRNVVFNAYNKNADFKLKKYILENYTWKKAAHQTLTAYNRVLAK